MRVEALAAAARRSSSPGADVRVSVADARRCARGAARAVAERVGDAVERPELRLLERARLRGASRPPSARPLGRRHELAHDLALVERLLRRCRGPDTSRVPCRRAAPRRPAPRSRARARWPRGDPRCARASRRACPLRCRRGCARDLRCADCRSSRSRRRRRRSAMRAHLRALAAVAVAAAAEHDDQPSGANGRTASSARSSASGVCA